MVSSLDIVLRMNTQVEADIDTVCADLQLGLAQRDRLIRAVTGYVSGNASLPIYKLCKAVSKADIGTSIQRSPHRYIHPQKLEALKLSERALFHFFLEIDAWSETGEVTKIMSSLTSEVSESDFTDAVRALANLLHKYRLEHLPMHRHRTKFLAIRRYLGTRERPEDGDAMRFWDTTADFKEWQRYKTAVGAIVDYSQNCKTYESAASAVYGDPELNENVTENLVQGDDEGIRLRNAIEAIDESPLKVFKETEVKKLYRFVHLEHYAWSWPKTGLTVWGYQPVQNGIVQDLRDHGSLSSIHLQSRLQEMPPASDVLKSAVDLHDLCRDALSLYLEIGKSLGKFPEDTPSLEQGGRQLMRRASFRERTPEELFTLLEHIGHHLVEIRGILEHIIKHWSRMIERKCGQIDTETVLFRKVIQRIYPTSDTPNG